MVTSCGLILTNGKELLLCHPTGNDFWNIPKGIPNDGESFLQACMREVEEETGLIYSAYRYIPLGRFSYLKNKDLVLFLVLEKDLPKTTSLVCKSIFQDKSGKWQPEHNGFMYADWDIAKSLVNISLVPILKEIESKVIYIKMIL